MVVCYSVSAGLLTLPSTSSQYQATPADTVASDTVNRPQSVSDTIVNTCPVTRGHTMTNTQHKSEIEVREVMEAVIKTVNIVICQYLYTEDFDRKQVGKLPLLKC